MVEQILYKGRKRKLYKGSRGGLYVIVLGKKVYIRNKKKTNKSYLNKFKLFGGTLPNKLHFNVETRNFSNPSKTFDFSFDIDTQHISSSNNMSIAYVTYGNKTVSIKNFSKSNNSNNSINIANILKLIDVPDTSKVLGICLFLDKDDSSKLKLYFFNNTKMVTEFNVIIHSIRNLKSIDRGSGTTEFNVDF